MADNRGMDRASAMASPSDPVTINAVPPSVPSIREAKLRPEFTARYVGIEPDVWFSAAGLAEQLITQLLRDGVPDQDLPQRVLDPAHFEFRGGEAGGARPASPR